MKKNSREGFKGRCKQVGERIGELEDRTMKCIESGIERKTNRTQGTRGASSGKPAYAHESFRSRRKN